MGLEQEGSVELALPMQPSAGLGRAHLSQPAALSLSKNCFGGSPGKWDLQSFTTISRLKSPSVAFSTCYKEERDLLS